MASETQLVFACLAMVILVLMVGLKMLLSRIAEMKEKRMDLQLAAATSLQMGSHLQNVQAADNFKNLFEVPVLFYTLIAVAIGLGHVPIWLVAGAWVFVLLRYLHSFIHCNYNKVMHRFATFGLSFLLVVALWIVFVVTLPVGNVI
jgi:hypothetical protein